MEPPAASVRLLGGFELQLAGVLVEPAPADRRLLATLAVHEAPLGRTFVAALLWPVAPSTAAPGRLRSGLHRLRKLAPGLVADAAAGQLRLAEHVAVDARVLSSWARSVLAGAAPEPRDDAMAIAADSLLLPDWDEPWVLLHRERLRLLRLQALEALTARLTAEGRYADAAQAGHAAVATAPLRESARRELIRALGAAGLHTDVAGQYDDYRRALRAELGIEPSMQLRKVMAALGSFPSRDGDAPVTGPG